MNKHLKATKVKDGWLAEVKVSHCLSTESEVLNLIRYEGLKLKNHHKKTKENPNEWIFAN